MKDLYRDLQDTALNFQAVIFQLFQEEIHEKFELEGYIDKHICMTTEFFGSKSRWTYMGILRKVKIKYDPRNSMSTLNRGRDEFAFEFEFIFELEGTLSTRNISLLSHAYIEKFDDYDTAVLFSEVNGDE